MARLPYKIVRFLVWITADREHRDDLLVAFDERFDELYEAFGPAYAHWWSVSQALRSLPYGLIARMIRWALLLWSFAS